MRLISAAFVCSIVFACGDSGSSDGSGGSGGGSNSGGATNNGGTDKGGGTSTGGDGTTNGGASMGGKSGKGSGGGTASGGKAATTGGAVGTGGSDVGGSPSTGGNPSIPEGLLNPKYVTTWNPGILKDRGDQPLGADGIPVRTTVCATVPAGGNIQAAIDACPEDQVVKLSAGAYTVSKTITLSKGVVLRGEGAQGTGGTTITKTGGNSVIQIGTSKDSACYTSAFGTAYPLTKDAVKGTTVVTIGSNASTFKAGDLALIDELDDDDVDQGDCPYYKRVDGRSTGERVEVVSANASAGTITLSTPLHWTFRFAAPHSAQIARVTQPIVRYAGIENVALRGGTNPGYNGQAAGGIDVSNAAHSWIKGVETDATIGGMHLAMTGTYRMVVRDSNFHHSANYGFGADCYGIVLRCASADNLIENNIVRYMNKPILFNASGGGNVIAYNYVDNSWATPAGYQEVNIDSHCAFPHMELIEGNYAPHMGATITHGNAGYLTFYRNYASSQFAPPAVAGSTAAQTGNITALEFGNGDLNMTAIGNVLGSDASNDLKTAPLSSVYTNANDSPPSIIKVSTSNVAFTSLWWHANYDTVMKGVRNNPMISVTTLPPSLFRGSKPGWWPASSPWPWAGSDLTPRVGTLPAKARSDAL